MAKKRHNEDKKLHNSAEKLHNSDISNDEGPDLTWQEAVDLLPEDEVDAGSEIYYFTDEDGNIHSREFLAQELIADDARDLEGSLGAKSRSTTPSQDMTTLQYAFPLHFQSLQDSRRTSIKQCTRGRLHFSSLSLVQPHKKLLTGLRTPS